LLGLALFANGCGEQGQEHSLVLILAPAAAEPEKQAGVDAGLEPLADRLRREFPDRKAFRLLAGETRRLQVGGKLQLALPERMLLAQATWEGTEGEQADSRRLIRLRLWQDRSMVLDTTVKAEPGQAGIAYLQLHDAHDHYLIAGVVVHPTSD
jgi:hypothetical protein